MLSCVTFIGGLGMISNKILLFLDSIGEKYYKIYLDLTNEVLILNLDIFEEMEYDKKRFLSSIKFDSEKDAKLYLTNNIEKLIRRKDAAN